MAKLMRASGYQQGDTVLVENTNYELILILNAPRPYPVLPHDYSLVSEKEKSLTRKQYLSNSPKWVVTVLDNQENIKSISGSTDYAYYVVSTPKTTSHSFNTSITRTGNMLSPMLSSVKLYKLINDIGYMKSWRLIENKNSSAPPL
jgi:hypothetical protein